MQHQALVPVNQDESGVRADKSIGLSTRQSHSISAPGMKCIPWIHRLPIPTGITPPFTWVPGGKIQQ